MTRSVAGLGSQTFDLLIVGAGVYGAALACEAAARGFSVAVIDRGDFAGGSSSNSLKILHGGLRYLQKFDLPRMRSSIRARRGWAQFGPAFVTPLACAIATRGFGMRSAGVLGGALLANELVSFDRNRGLAGPHRLPPARLLSRDEYADMTRGVCAPSGSGGALWWDALAVDTERLVLELLARAADAGAVLANYVEAKSIVTSAGAVQGVMATDVEAHAELKIESRRVVCTGAAANFLAGSFPGLQRMASAPLCHALNIIVERALPTATALALPVAGAVAKSGTRAVQGELFFVPWRGRTMIGTHYALADGHSASMDFRRRSVREFLAVVRTAAPQWDLRESEVSFVHWGELPMDERWQPGEPIRLDSRTQIVDAAKMAPAAGLWLLRGPKFTTALETARIALPRIAKGVSPTSRGKGAAPRSSSHTDALQRMDREADLGAKARLAAAALYARRLEDVVLRRTACGTGGHPGRSAIEACARGMASALQWPDARIAAEIAAVEQHYRDWHCYQPRESTP